MEDKIIYGTRAVIEAVKEDHELERLFIQRGINNPLMNELRALLKKKEIIYQLVPVEKLNRISTGNHQGVVAFLSSVSYYHIEEILPELFADGKIPLLLLLDRVTDVRNFGAIARTCECFGVHAVIIPSRGGAQINSDAIKTSAGALHKITVCREHNLKTVLNYLAESGLQIVACTEKTDAYIQNVDFKIPTVIIMGSEENGISGEYLKVANVKAKIPMDGNIESLNVSVAAAVILYEAIRQRTAKPEILT